MVAKLIDGKALAKKMLIETRDAVSTRIQQGLRAPSLAVILVGDDPASHIYVRNKRQACEETGIQSIYHPLPASTTEKEIIELIQQLNAAHHRWDPITDTIPTHIDSNKLLGSLILLRTSMASPLQSRQTRTTPPCCAPAHLRDH